MSQANVFGAILGGGAGSRLGGRKAMALLAGKPLAAHVADALRSQVSGLAVVGDAECAEALGIANVPDLIGLPKGPLTGICSAAEWAQEKGGEWLLVAPCDAPLLLCNLGARLLAGIGGRVVAYAKTADGVHPLASVWRCSLAARLRETLAYAHPSVRSVMETLGATPVCFEEAGAFMNVNTPDDLLRAEAMMAARGR